MILISIEKFLQYDDHKSILWNYAIENYNIYKK